MGHAQTEPMNRFRTGLRIDRKSMGSTDPMGPSVG